MQLVRIGNCSPGYVQLQVDDPMKHVPMNSNLYGLVPKLMKLLKHDSGDKYFVMPESIRKWINGVIDNSIKQLTSTWSEYGVLKVKRSTSGPALTLHIELESGSDLDIDLVPVFAFKPNELEFYDNVYANIDTSNGGPQWLQGRGKNFQKTVKTALKHDFYIVPKPSNQMESEWRLDFHDAETKIIENFQCAKPVIKFLKLFRTCNSPLKKLSSYSLKTVVMDMIRNDPHDDWRESEQAEHFLQALKHLLKLLENQKINYFFDASSNILWKDVKPVQVMNMVNFLKKAIEKLETSANTADCKKVWMQYFECKK